MYRFIVNLSQEIQIRSQPETSSTYKDSTYFRKTFPYFFWLLRDVMLSIPKEYEDIEDYFLRKVFPERVLSSSDQEATVVSSILDFFPLFCAFDLPPPTVDKEVMKNINQEKSQLSPAFLRGLEQLKVKLETILSPKRSFNDGEFVTGEALAALVNNYVAALNTPGAVPNVQSAWETFIQTKCSEVKAAAMRLYEGTMTSQLDGALPCDSDEIRRVHEMAMEESLKEFQTGTVQISAESCKKYLEELMEHIEKDLKRWHEENQQRTKKSCQKLLHGLKKKHLDPIFQRLTGPMGASVSFDQIKDSVLAIESDFKKLAKGAKDVCAQEFFKFQPELESEMEKHKALLKQLKDYDEKLSQERKERALQEKENQRILEENARVLKENLTKQKEMELLMAKQKNHIKRLKKQHQKEIKEQQIQIENRIKAEVDLYKKDMDAIVEQNRELNDKMDDLHQDMEKKDHEIRRMKMASTSTYMGVVAIDFGTTYSGFAFSFSDQNGQGGIHTKMNWGENKELERSGTPKTPTTILLLPNKNFDSFGYDADDTYVNLKPGDDKQYYYFKHFKMELHKRQDLDRNTQLTAANGKNVDAITVFSLSMKYLKDEAVKNIREATKDDYYKAEDFQWVLTVPAIWTAAAKQFMREAAYQAGIASPDNKEQLIIALEPEAGAIFCKERKLKDFVGQTGSARVSDALVSPGKGYVMMDIGGGTLDVTAHESLDSGKIREIYKVTGGAYGGMYVDGNFVSLLENRYGQSAIEDFRFRYPKDWLELMNNFEEKKTGRRASEGKVTRIRASQKFLQTVSSTSATAGRPHNEYVNLEPEEMKQLFEPVVSGIVTHMEEVLKHPELNSVSCLFMVGGFANSLILQEAIATAFSSRCKILIPITDPAIAVVQGATMFGQKPTTISSRVMATTYGFRSWRDFDPKVHDPQKKAIIEGRKKCKDIFCVFVKENEAVEVGETKRTMWNPLYSDQKSVSFIFYTSTNPDAKYTTDPSVGPSIGKMTVDSPDTSKGKNRQIELSIFFGGTEIKASAIDKTSGNVAAVKLDFLSKS